MHSTILVFFALLLMVTGVLAQSQQPRDQTGVLRLRVRVKADDAAPLRGLARKRFFLIPGTLEQNRALIEAIERQPLVNARLLLHKTRRERGADRLAERQATANRSTAAVSRRILSLDQKRCLSLRLRLRRVRRSLAAKRRRDSG